MTGDALVIILILVLGIAALLFGLLYVIARAFGEVGKGFFAVLRGPRDGRGQRPRVRVCSREQCGKTEVREGRYCSQCGAPLIDGPPDRK